MSNIKILSLSELAFTSPDTFITKDGSSIAINKKTLKNVMYSLGLVGDKFSKDLYDIDETIWTSLVKKKCDISPYYTDNSVIIANDEIISVVSNSNRDWLLVVESMINKISTIDGFSVKTLKESEGFSVLCLNNDKEGYIISVNITEKHITSQNVVIKNEILFIYPQYTVNCYIDSGINCQELESLLNHEVLMIDNEVDIVDDYINYISNADMSYSDSSSALKLIYGIKIKSRIENYNNYLDYIDSSQFTINDLELASRLLKEIYDKGYQFITNSQWLEKHLRFVPVKYYDYIRELSSRYLNGYLEFSTIKEEVIYSFSKNLDYTIVNRVKSDNLT